MIGWLPALQPQRVVAAHTPLRHRTTSQEIHIFQPENATWQVSLRLTGNLRVGRVWQQEDRLYARIHNGVGSFVLTSSDGRVWKTS